MKKTWLLLFALLCMGMCVAQADNTDSVYDVLNGLINGRTFTLTVNAESDADKAAELISRYGSVTCTLCQEKDEILLAIVCDGDAYLNAAATKDGIGFETSLLGNGSFHSSWDALEPVILEENGTVSITMTGPDHELIRFTCKVSGTDPDDCQAEIDIGYITGPGNVHSLWDGITNKSSETSREFYFTFSEEEYGMECEGTSTVEIDEDGSMIITREETGTLTYQEDDLGEITFHSRLTIH